MLIGRSCNHRINDRQIKGTGNFHLIFYMPELIAFNKPTFTNAGGSKSAYEPDYSPGYPEQALRADFGTGDDGTGGMYLAILEAF